MTPTESNEHEARLRGALLGTALGDALGLVTEGLSARVIARRFAKLDRFHLIGATGFVSDDTEQTALVAQSLARSPHDVDAFVRAFRRALLGWFLRLPWGIGFATLRACVRIALGLRRSGVRSAGNGAAMRAAIVGVFFRADPQARARFGRALATVTHTDARAVDGALFVAELAALCAQRDAAGLDRDACAQQALSVVEEPSLRGAIERALSLAQSQTPSDEAARALGVTGFVLHTVPLAAFMFARFGHEPMRAIEETIRVGGDTDTNAAIVGACVGALHGPAALSQDTLAKLQRGPFGRAHLEALAHDLTHAPARTAHFAWAAAMARNLFLYPVVLAHGLRRLVPF